MITGGVRQSKRIRPLELTSARAVDTLVIANEQSLGRSKRRIPGSRYFRWKEKLNAKNIE
jgi:hypothetical protein